MQLLLSLSAVLGLASAHMQMTSPAPLRSKHNPYTTNVDYDMNSPLLANGANFPCKGYHALLDTPQGRPVATWRAGGRYSLSVEGTATHNGGSCQASLSYDRGRTFTAIHSFVGGCPLTPTWDFTLPDDAPAGDALFAWSWFNQIGNREMYMNCAHVIIQPRAVAAARQQQQQEEEEEEEEEEKKVSLVDRASSDPFQSRPRMFVANVGNGCSTVEGSDVLFPNLGPDVDNISRRTAAPRGTCPF